jgi:hypothetical protein
MMPIRFNGRLLSRGVVAVGGSDVGETGQAEQADGGVA